MSRELAGVGCIVLAAGSGSRFGSDKRLAKLGEETLLERTLGNITPVFGKRILVLRADDEALGSRFASEWQVVLAADAGKGMGHSLAAAMACTVGWNGAVVALADMPFVRTSTYGAVRAALTATNLVIPYYREQRGNPVGIGKRFFPELACLEGDQGARTLLQQHAAAVVRVEVEDPGVLRDIDTPAALEAPGQEEKRNQ
jgi:molybdenum cofactor cytidylyltransferase